MNQAAVILHQSKRVLPVVIDICIVSCGQKEVHKEADRQVHSDRVGG